MQFLSIVFFVVFSHFLFMYNRFRLENDITRNIHVMPQFFSLTFCFLYKSRWPKKEKKITDRTGLWLTKLDSFAITMTIGLTTVFVGVFVQLKIEICAKGDE